MNEASENELSEADLAVLRAFDSAEEVGMSGAGADRAPHELSLDEQTTSSQLSSSDPFDGMLVLFVTEADEDIAAMRQALQQLEQGALPTTAMLQVLRRTAHKLKGTAGAVGCEHVSSIARYIELLVDLAHNDAVPSEMVLAVLTQAVEALETTLYSVVSDGQESNAPLAALEEVYTALKAGVEYPLPQPLQEDAATVRPMVQVDGHHLEQLVLHIEQMVQQAASLEHAQAQVETAQQELHVAQVRLQHLETLLSTLLATPPVAGNRTRDESAMSSLVAHILREAVQRTGHVLRRKNKHNLVVRPQGTTLYWDELEVDPYRKDGLLAQSLSEAIADVALASSRLSMALAHLSRILQKYMAQNALVRTDALLLQPAHEHIAVRGLLVRVGNQRVVVPFVQVHSISYGQSEGCESLYMLNMLLGFPRETSTAESLRPVLLLHLKSIAIEVDEVLGEVELVMKPLAAHLQRSGIVGTVIDNMGNVLLVLDVPELVMQHEAPHRVLEEQVTRGKRTVGQPRRCVLIADDSLSMRQSLLQILTHAGYNVLEAHDGKEALAQLYTHLVDVLLLDIEMPNLNGYDLLAIIHATPQFAQLKVAMLTSRSSEKHQRQARELGAHAYLTKPCPHELLLDTLQSLLAN